ncbi:hypothetical protein DL98DRAFT_514447 [Cadophora sp. DSE1049]|nr:hypothetical protein DL98DRAFT_514447 [Cadophora sp. DSE1049]
MAPKLEKKTYRPREGGPPKRPRKPDLNLGRRDPSKRIPKQEPDIMSHHQSPSYTLTGRDKQTIVRGIEAIEDMTLALDSQQTWLAQALKTWGDVKKEDQALKHRELDLEQKKFDRDNKNLEAHHQRFLLGAFVVLFLAWIFGAWLRVFGKMHHVLIHSEHSLTHLHRLEASANTPHITAGKIGSMDTLSRS